MIVSPAIKDSSAIRGCGEGEGDEGVRGGGSEGGEGVRG